MQTLDHLMFPFAYLPMASGGWTVSWVRHASFSFSPYALGDHARLFFSIPSDADTGSLDVSICLLANGECGVDRLVIWCLVNVRVYDM
ncbi:hypothetical protein VNO80_14550 [Phaseolus coccineus]|uniref:Uncharacterized protein n=1 Tax=Phaseolus coccineus TaxID=3886 RepID=A0AAN9R1H7_PHACN